MYDIIVTELIIVYSLNSALNKPAKYNKLNNWYPHKITLALINKTLFNFASLIKEIYKTTLIIAMIIIKHKLIIENTLDSCSS